MCKTLLLALMFMLLLPAISSIAFAEGSPEFKACLEGSDSSTFSIKECASEEQLRQKARMDIAYNKLLQKLTNSGASLDVSKLVNAQRAWLIYAEEYSDLLYGGEFGGSLQRLIAISWLADVTADRADELEDCLETIF